MLNGQHSVNHPILDSMKRIIAVLVAKPKDPTYDAAALKVFQLMEELGDQQKFTAQDYKHPRGPFPAVNFGIALGPGGTEPMRLKMGTRRTRMMATLQKDQHVQRLAAHQDCRFPAMALSPNISPKIFLIASFQFWAPALYNEYKTMIDKLTASGPDLEMNFKHGVFSSMAFNFPLGV